MNKKRIKIVAKMWVAGICHNAQLSEMEGIDVELAEKILTEVYNIGQKLSPMHANSLEDAIMFSNNIDV